MLELLTREEVRSEVESIRTFASDAERAHSAEDVLYLRVLAAIAAGRCESPAACAAEAIKTQEISFMRWCA